MPEQTNIPIMQKAVRVIYDMSENVCPADNFCFFHRSFPESEILSAFLKKMLERADGRAEIFTDYSVYNSE